MTRQRLLARVAPVQPLLYGDVICDRCGIRFRCEHKADRDGFTQCRDCRPCHTPAQDILNLHDNGWTNRHIANELEISIHSVRYHLRKANA